MFRTGGPSYQTGFFFTTNIMVNQHLTRERVRILLVQFRDDPLIRAKEYDSFVKFMKLDPHQVISWDVTRQPITESLLEGVDALIVAGNGGGSVLGDNDYNEPIKSLLKAAYEKNVPTLAVCYGAQFSALALGGKVERNPDMRETGTYKMYLTQEGRADAIFDGVADTFNGQQGHNDSVTVLPEGAIRLTYSDACPNQAFTFEDKPFYAVQYHPELDEEELRFRFNYYKDYYADNPDEWQAIMDNIQDSREASLILEKFVDKVVLDHYTHHSKEEKVYSTV